MSELEDKLGAVLSNPQLMQQIMTLAQSMNQSAPEQSPPPAAPPAVPPAPSPDPGFLQRLRAVAGQSGIDDHQKALLKALSPYLSRGRVEKLERAMRAARMTEMASSLLGSGVLDRLIGR